MLILAIDTALEACAAALHNVETDTTLAVERLPMARGHAETLVPMIGRLMEQAKTSFDTIDAFAVTVGPGSFTGLRVGLSAARGFGLATGRPVIGLSTLATLAAPPLADEDAVPVVAALDARHENLYVQMFGAGGRVLIGARAMNVRDAARAVAIGPVRLVGSGAAILAEHWPAGQPAPLSVDAEATPDPVWLARLAAIADPARSPPRPLYLRGPDARPQDGARIAR
ncbi:tRNA (adenosine(37)-N6)-threonylcarbamoyltransferase complex dimerization subunit type 1 TsaB [Ancylobacter sp. 6x-1]|uniref:tRNA (Adenosine(37)-N6)-threonylcarbamoyltransferase complex dimerization subunit type 1 TsaB n=1 Tax=Ancylobacter crimeensis TaxID=2579147 RepID=A0ABT0DDI4_9HYPH|nr:tRNA (adenosine(37)-N6)-threonylcarbamoyltransferase complex dimerization subunit type 1 TsaB [Ancylobacter crimeensis]MCK0198012.1 tRNA (adenosine(37)-N6)-threonylcarbamoyltransferase complex dimerization subunit type 1 TsaB [Ancylobacter crimeensis]